MRPFDERGERGAKQKKEYILDKDGNKIYDPKKRQYKCKSIPATDWNEQTKAEQILFTTAEDYLKGVMNSNTTVPTKAWKEEYTKLTAERKTLNRKRQTIRHRIKQRRFSAAWFSAYIG
ncbi:MobA/MobL family protein [Parablautia intestinalis]|uniref:MobA/MobL family protein n=1 Tax=Parablautia intestinalis TaxID=2320100 RepID=UPI0038CD9AB7